MTLTPAYGRDYKNRASVVADLNAGLDFMANSYDSSGYISVKDIPDGSVQVRDKSLRKVWVIRVTSGRAS